MARKQTEAKYTSSSVATEKFGVEFRSKLEAEWAYFFDKKGMDWMYADKEDYDFKVNGVEVEVKPMSIHLIVSAIKRARLTSDLLILAGNPDSHLKVWCNRCTKDPDVFFDHEGAVIEGIRRCYCSMRFFDSSFQSYCTSFNSRWFLANPPYDVLFLECKYKDLEEDHTGARFYYNTKCASNAVEWGFVFLAPAPDEYGELPTLVYSAEFSDDDKYGMQCSESFITECKKDFSNSSMSAMSVLCGKHNGLLDELKNMTWYRNHGG